MGEPVVIKYQAQVFKVQTLIDGGLRLTLDLVSPVIPETIVQLFDAKQPGIILDCASVVTKQKETSGRGKRRNTEEIDGNSSATY